MAQLYHFRSAGGRIPVPLNGRTPAPARTSEAREPVSCAGLKLRLFLMLRDSITEQLDTSKYLAVEALS